MGTILKHQIQLFREVCISSYHQTVEGCRCPFPCSTVPCKQIHSSRMRLQWCVPSSGEVDSLLEYNQYTLIGKKVPFLAKECHRGHQVRPTWDSYPMSKRKRLVTTQSNCKIYSCFSWFVSENVNFTRSHLITKVARTPRGCLPALQSSGDV